MLLAAFYAQCRLVLSPSVAADAALGRSASRPSGSCAGTAAWTSSASARLATPRRRCPAGFNVLYVGRLGQEKNIDLLADAFLLARRHDPRLHLCPGRARARAAALRRRLGNAATFLGWVGGDPLARAYASADLFMFASMTDTFGQVILEAQASGLPVLAVDAGGPADLIESGRSGCLVAPSAEALAEALHGLARREAIRERLATGGLVAVRERTWERSLRQLAEGYTLAIGAPLERPGSVGVTRAA